MRNLLTCLFLIFPLIADAHPVSLSWANARIADGKIWVHFSILVEDLVLFHHIKADENYDFDPLKLKALAEDHASLIEKYFFIVDENENRLPSRVVSINTGSLDKEKINVKDLMKYKLHYQLVFDLENVHWEKLVFHQEFTSAKAGIPAITFLTVVKDGEKLVDKTEVTPGKPFILKPRGNTPERNPSELSSSYFTITPTGIRHEMTMPANVFHSMIYQPHLGESLYDNSSFYFKKNNPVLINNNLIIPELQLIQTFETTNGEMSIPEDGLVYFDLFYPSEDPIDSATIRWSDYSWKFRWFKSKIRGMDGTFQHTFSRFSPEFFWRNQLKINRREF